MESEQAVKKIGFTCSLCDHNCKALYDYGYGREGFGSYTWLQCKNAKCKNHEMFVFEFKRDISGETK